MGSPLPCESATHVQNQNMRVGRWREDGREDGREDVREDGREPTPACGANWLIQGL